MINLNNQDIETLLNFFYITLGFVIFGIGARKEF